jgi:hypothetical protein
MDFPFDDTEIPAHWWDDDRVLTRNADALHMLFPAGERFFMRSVRAFVPQLKDPELLARVRGFMGQEAMHGREHRRAFALLERDGIEYESFLEDYEDRWLKGLEQRSHPMTNLAVTCALEHLTATLGASAFEDPLMERAHPTMRELMLWHAAEEVEHKAVAYDVYEAVGGGWLRRVTGMVVAFAFLMVWWRRGMLHLIEQDGGVTRADIGALRHKAKTAGRDVMAECWRASLQYIRPGFHPNHIDDRHLAEDYFASRTAAA